MSIDAGISTRSMRLLEVRRDAYLVLFTDESGKTKVRTLPKNAYTELKYGLFKGERIYYKFADKVDIQETYDDGIFNCNYKDQFLQIRDKKGITGAVKDHQNRLAEIEKIKNTPKPKPKDGEEEFKEVVPNVMNEVPYIAYANIFKQYYAREHRWDLVKYMVAAYRKRVTIEPDVPTVDILVNDGITPTATDGVINIDNIWTIDSRGTAYCDGSLTIRPPHDIYAGVEKLPLKLGTVCRACGEPIAHEERCYRLLAKNEKTELTTVRSDSTYIHPSHLEKIIHGKTRVCLVVSGTIHEAIVPTPIGDMILDETGQVIISKVFFLLNPNMKDQVFTSQVPRSVMDKMVDVLAHENIDKMIRFDVVGDDNPPDINAPIDEDLPDDDDDWHDTDE